MTERIEKKLKEIEKIQKRIKKWEDKRNEESFKKEYADYIDNNNYEEIKTRMYEFYINDCDTEIRIAKKALENANEQLEKIKKQEAKKSEQNKVIDELPEAIKTFMEKLETTWNEWDIEMKQFYKEKYRTMSGRELIQEYGRRAYDLIHMTTEQIKKNNKKDVRALVENLYRRINDRVGKIIDATGLCTRYGNQGYIVINGTVIGEKGHCTVESIGAGGYNIQRYHIRTIVR